jgi:hypothetical protein
LHAHDDVARVQVQPQLDRFGLGFHQAFQQFRDVSIVCHSGGQVGRFSPACPPHGIYCPELNPVERFGGLLKAQVRNRLYPNLRKLEDHLAAAAKRWTAPDKVAGLIHAWLADTANSGAPP